MLKLLQSVLIEHLRNHATTEEEIAFLLLCSVTCAILVYVIWGRASKYYDQGWDGKTQGVHDFKSRRKDPSKEYRPALKRLLSSNASVASCLDSTVNAPNRDGDRSSEWSEQQSPLGSEAEHEEGFLRRDSDGKAVKPAPTNIRENESIPEPSGEPQADRTKAASGKRSSRFFGAIVQPIAKLLRYRSTSPWYRYSTSECISCTKVRCRGASGGTEYSDGMLRVWSGFEVRDLPGHGEDSATAFRNFHVLSDGVGGSKTSSFPMADALTRHVGAGLSKFSEDFKTVNKALLYRTVQEGIRRARDECLRNDVVIGATLSVAYIDMVNQVLHTLTLGDSKTVVIRNGSIVFETLSVVQTWNVPAIVCTAPRDCSDFLNWQAVNLEPDDVVVTMSDGVADNVFVEELLDCVNSFKIRSTSQPTLSQDAQKLSSEIAHLAERRANSIGDFKPFALSAAAAYCRNLSRVCGGLVQQKPKLGSIAEDPASIDEGSRMSPMRTFASVSESQLAYAMEVERRLENEKRSLMDAEVYICEELDYYTLEQLRQISEVVHGKRDDISTAVHIVQKRSQC